jgi:hypothetical protein
MNYAPIFLGGAGTWEKGINVDGQRGAFNDDRTLSNKRQSVASARSVRVATLVDQHSTCKDQYETANQSWFPKGEAKSRTVVFPKENNGKHYTALSVGRDFTSQGNDLKLRKTSEKGPHTTYPNPHSRQNSVDQHKGRFSFSYLSFSFPLR